ncbi:MULTISPECIES: disulfide bond formation protein B [unclassified Ectothiorhodospira]|uniref:disulfide bond formation protein B n=1 Tax=unclassified Ectothiorhodospira TaxID=2684909 RepID=UPI001EE87BB2|nr:MULTISPECIES: disulfide bond formation protein B [unclassified Ectothiorhodospira]MCG5514650.1 disulfide bond formation protein B [Ectothiorhodospira sp. 9100]MCG5517976.1 disulfide bond formation protein B [Ectothiorhodospira sp. 9905]
MFALAVRPIWLAIALFCALAAGLSIGLTEIFNLHPCHLCIFQRLLFMVLAVLALGGALFGAALPGTILGALVVATAGTGLGFASYQSWLERQPAELGFSCMGAEQGPIERLVEWLGEQAPTLFMATGMCDEMGPQFLGLSFANAALVGHLIVALLGIWALWRSRQAF